VVLEALTPLERAAFLLHDVFGHDHAAVAVMLDRSPAAVRQLASRARAHVAAGVRRHRADRTQARQVTEAFLAACAGEDVDGMLQLLAPDVVFVGDGGGLATAVPVPIHGVQRVAKMLLGFTRVGQRRGLTVDLVEVNTEPAILVCDGDRVEVLLVIEVTEGRIAAIRGIRNPEKLTGFRGCQPVTEG
jgi:RNA polymerase sigma-70 factor (ECF subfamily)